MSSLNKTVSNKEEVKSKKVSKKSQATKVKKKKIDNNSNKKIDIKKYLTKVNITYFVFLLVDIVLVIYLARQNIVNYAVILDKEIFVSKTRYLLWGRNYVNVIVIAFFYIYGCLLNKFFLKRKLSKKFLVGLLAILLILNVLLFIIFTKRVY